MPVALRWNISLISLVALLVVGAAGILGCREQSTAIPQTALVQEAAGLRVAFQVTESAPGTWRVDVWVRDQAEQPVDLQAVDVRFAMPFICTTDVRTTLAATAPGHFQAQNVSFVMSGSWTGEVTLRRDGQPGLQVAFLVPVTVPETLAGPTPIDNADALRLSAGQRLYVANCVSCHGVGGRGDGPDAAGLTPQPADFSEHMVLGKHSDPEIFLMIHQGFAGSVMRGYKDTLSPDEIWQLVAYLRTLAQSTTAPTAGPASQAPETTPGAASGARAGPPPIAEAAVLVSWVAPARSSPR